MLRELDWHPYIQEDSIPKSGLREQSLFTAGDGANKGGTKFESKKMDGGKISAQAFY